MVAKKCTKNLRVGRSAFLRAVWRWV